MFSPNVVKFGTLPRMENNCINVLKMGSIFRGTSYQLAQFLFPFLEIICYFGTVAFGFTIFEADQIEGLMQERITGIQFLCI